MRFRQYQLTLRDALISQRVLSTRPLPVSEGSPFIAPTMQIQGLDAKTFSMLFKVSN